LAEFLGAVGQGRRHGQRYLLRSGANVGPLQPLRRPPRPRLQRRPEADGPSLLHERHRDDLQAGSRLTSEASSMTLFLLAYLGGVLTIVSPCILPVLPFVFARADRPFVRSGLPMLVGMAVTFAVVATLAAVAGGWAVAANQYGRAAAMLLLA